MCLNAHKSGHPSGARQQVLLGFHGFFSSFELLRLSLNFNTSNPFIIPYIASTSLTNESQINSNKIWVNRTRLAYILGFSRFRSRTVHWRRKFNFWLNVKRMCKRLVILATQRRRLSTMSPEGKQILTSKLPNFRPPNRFRHYREFIALQTMCIFVSVLGMRNCISQLVGNY
jgi:hypothetical protein